MAEINSSSDFIKMQEQAIKRVREMHRKSQASAEEKTPPEIKSNKTEDAPEKEKPKEKPPIIIPQKPSEAKTKTDFEKKREDHNPFSALLNLDADKSLVLPLLLFLGKEGVDDMLLLALLYIMS